MKLLNRSLKPTRSNITSIIGNQPRNRKATNMTRTLPWLIVAAGLALVWLMGQMASTNMEQERVIHGLLRQQNQMRDSMTAPLPMPSRDRTL